MSKIDKYADLLTADQREEKLPRWAQQSLRGLRHALDAEWKRADQARLATKPDETDTIIDRYSDIPIGLPKGSWVRYRVGPHDLLDYFEVRANGEGIDVSAGGPMVVLPHVTNVVRLEMRDGRRTK